MITAMQEAKLAACERLRAARDNLIVARPLICWKDGDRRISHAIERIDDLLEDVLPSNEVAT